MHRATQLLVLTFPLCSLDMHAHCSVMGFRAGKTIDGAWPLQSSLLAFHGHSGGKQWPGIAGNGAGREQQFLSLHGFHGYYCSSFPQGRSCKWERCCGETPEPLLRLFTLRWLRLLQSAESPGWAVLSPRHGPWAAASAPSTFRASAVLALQEANDKFWPASNAVLGTGGRGGVNHYTLARIF